MNELSIKMDVPLADAILAVCAIIGLVYGVVQLWGIRKTVKLNRLSAILSLESEMNKAKKELDKINIQILQLSELQPQNYDAEIKRLEREVPIAREDYLNKIDRLCFCIIKNLLPDRELRAEYRTMILEAVKTHEDMLGEGSGFINIIDLNRKWKRS